MSRSGRNDWRRVAAAAALIAVLVFGLGFVLRAAGLGAAANVAQLVSLAPIVVSVVNWSRGKSLEKVDPGLDESGTSLPGVVMLSISIVLLCIVVAALVLQIWNLAPHIPRRAVDWTAAVAGLVSCIAFVMYRVFVRRQSLPLSSSLRALLERQRDLAQRHQYLFSEGTAPPIAQIYVDQWADWLMAKSMTGLPAMSLTLPDMLRGSRHAIILADPGVGKSTAVAQVVRHQSEWWLNAKRFMNPDDAPYGPVMPIVIPADLHRCDNLPAAMARQWTELTDVRVDAQAFKRKPPYAEAWLVLIDGIDQLLGTRDRLGLLNWLSAWTADPVSQVRFLLTSRQLLGGELGLLPVGHVGRYRLRRFDLEGLHRFVEQWAAFRASQPGTDLRPITAEEFMAAIRTAKLVSLAQVPLVATITALILENGQETELPTSRAELYERFITQLFSSRDMELLRDQVPEQWRPYGRSGRRAWEWLLDRLRDMLEGAAHRHLSADRKGVIACASQWAEENAPAGHFAGLPNLGSVLKELLTTTSLVVPSSTGLEFWHPNIEEYLAAGPRSDDFNAETWVADARSGDSRSLALFILARRRVPSAPGQESLADQLVERIIERGGAELCIAGAIIADGIDVTASARIRVLDGLMDLLSQDGPEIGEALDVLTTLASHDDVFDRLVMFAEDAAQPGWVRADVADELCGLSRETGVRLLRVVLVGTHDSLLRDRILSRLDARGDLQGGDRDGNAADAVNTAPSEGMRAGHWYRQIAQDSGADASHRLRALLAMAERRDPGWTSMLAEIITAPGLPDYTRRDAASRIGQLANNGGVEILRHLAEEQEQGLEIRVSLLAGLADAQDEDSRQALNQLAAVGGSGFRQRFPWALASQVGTLSRSSEQSSEPVAVHPAGDHQIARTFGLVPARDKNFIGRGNILDRLRQELQSGTTTSTSGASGQVLISSGGPYVLEGLGGVGKTAIAIEYAHRYQSDYDLVWWVNADSRTSITAALAGLAGRLGAEAAGVTGTEEAAESVIDALRRGEPFRRWLLIFDNADRPEELADFLPVGPGHILITSRNRSWESAARVRDVDVFSRDESVELLGRLLGRTASEPTFHPLSSKLGDLPLALALAGAYLRDTGMTPGKYTELLDAQMSGLLSDGSSESQPPLTVRAAYELSVSRMPRPNPDALELLRYYSFFGPEPIPRDVLRSPGQGSGIEPLVADPVALAQLNRELDRLALITVNTRTLTVHRLVQKLVRDEISADDQAAYRHEVQLMLAMAMPKDPDDDSSWPRYQELLPHVMGPALEWERSRKTPVRECALRVLRYLNASGDAASGRGFAERLITQWIADSGPNDTHALHGQRQLSVALRQLGQVASADQLAEETLNRARQALGEHDPLTQALRGYASTDLVVVLGGAVVRKAFKLWAGDVTLADDISADLTDLIGDRVKGALDQRKLRRQFSNMEDIVAEQVLPMLSAEYQGLDEGEKNAAVIAVTETLNKARLTGEVLLTADLDPFSLSKAVRRFAGEAIRDLSRDGTALYEQLLTQCCAYIIEIADKLPSFQPGAFAELLTRDEQILARLNEVLERLPAPSRTDPSDAIATAYRRTIVRRLDRLELFGLDFAAQWYPLRTAYVDLNLSVLPKSRERSEGPGTEPIEHWLNECPRLLINAGAGNGKTTLLQWIAVRAALRDFTGAMAPLNGYTPFLLQLRRYLGRALPAPEEFLDDVAALLAPEAGSWPREQLRSGQAFVLVDGLDEVPEDQRPMVLGWLRQLTEVFPLARYVVTSRPGAIDQDALGDAGFVTAMLSPMDPGLVRVFIDRWHTGMREWQKDVQEVERLLACRDTLLQTLDNDSFLSELVKTPLLAALVCALNLHLRAHLPQRRGDVISMVLQMFYERDRMRGIPGTSAMDLNSTIHLLSELALWMVRNGQIEFSVAEAARILGLASRSLPNSLASDADLYQYLLSHSGVLRESTNGNAEFAHRTFQEYLAANALVRNDNIGEISTNADDEQWREIVVFASGLGTVRQTSELLRDLLKPSWRGSGRYRRRLLAVACLDEIRMVEPNVLADIDRVIPELLPARSFEQAEALSHAGERLLPHLAGLKSFSDVDETSAVIRVAALIGGPSALDVIARIASRDKVSNPRLPGWPALREEYLRAWQYFPGSRYAERVLLPAGIVDLEVTNPRLLGDIAHLSVGIASVTLRGLLENELDLSAISAATLSELRIIACEARRISGLNQPWTSVRRLRLEALANLVDVPAARLLPKLEELDLVYCDKLTDYRPFARLANLRAVRIEGRPAGDIAAFAELADIEQLTIMGADEVDLASFAGRRLDIVIGNSTRIAGLPTPFRPTIRRI